MKKGITIAGNIVADIIKFIEKYPNMGMLSNISSIKYGVGGCVPNTVIDLAKIDNSVPLYAMGKIGNDVYGTFILDVIKKYNINTDGIKISKTDSTGFSDVMTVAETGDRTFFSYLGANDTYEINDINIESIKTDIFHIGYLLLLKQFDKPDKKYGTKMAKLLNAVQNAGIKTSIDAVSNSKGNFKETVKPALAYCNYAIMNEIEATSVLGIPARNSNNEIIEENIIKTLKAFFEYGVKNLVIIHAPEIGYCMNKNYEFFKINSLKLPSNYIKGSVGAGDAFCAGCLYGIYNNFTEKEILRFASCAAACNLAEPDSISGMKNKNEILNMENIYRRLS